MLSARPGALTEALRAQLITDVHGLAATDHSDRASNKTLIRGRSGCFATKKSWVQIPPPPTNASVSAGTALLGGVLTRLVPGIGRTRNDSGRFGVPCAGLVRLDRQSVPERRGAVFARRFAAVAPLAALLRPATINGGGSGAGGAVALRSGSVSADVAERRTG